MSWGWLCHAWLLACRRLLGHLVFGFPEPFFFTHDQVGPAENDKQQAIKLLQVVDNLVEVVGFSIGVLFKKKVDNWWVSFWLLQGLEG